MPFLPPKPKRFPFSLSTPSMMSIYAAPPGRWLVGADLSQLEARVVAALAQDAVMLNCFQTGKDLHALNAQGLFRVPAADWPAHPEKGTMRDLAKIFLYGGLMYGGSPKTIHEQLLRKRPKTTAREVEEAIAAWVTEHPAITEWQHRQVANAKRDGYVEIPGMGTRSYFYGKLEPTICLNFPVQGVGAFAMKQIIKRVAARIDWVRTAIIMQIHDALYLETDDPVGAWSLLKEEMTRTMYFEHYELPLEADVGISNGGWGDVKKCKTIEAARALVGAAA